MDILDDVVVLLRVLLDYVGIDLEDVQSLVEELNARRRQRFYQTRHAISRNWNSIVFRRQCVLNRLNRVQSDIKHKSLIRILGSYLPFKPVKRVRIQNHLLQSRHPKYMYDSDSDDSVITSTSFGSSDDDVVWVEEDMGDNCVRVRAQRRKEFEEDDLFDELDAGLFIARPSLSPMSSTMISSVSTRIGDPDQTQKLTAMEDELNNLKQQIAMLVEAQEQINQSHVPAQSFQEESSAEDVPLISLPPHCPVPPPPPPPPLPPMPQSTPTIIGTTKTQTPLSQENKGNTSDLQKSVPTMSEVLKGLGNVKLRSIQRSPGGTPLKPKPHRRESNADPASVIARALKKKFANQQLNSPDIDKENDSYGAFSSPETNTPNIGLPKRVKRRSILFDEKSRLSGHLRL